MPEPPGRDYTLLRFHLHRLGARLAFGALPSSAQALPEPGMARELVAECRDGTGLNRLKLLELTPVLLAALAYDALKQGDEAFARLFLGAGLGMEAGRGAQNQLVALFRVLRRSAWRQCPLEGVLPGIRKALWREVQRLEKSERLWSSF